MLLPEQVDSSSLCLNTCWYLRAILEGFPFTHANRRPPMAGQCHFLSAVTLFNFDGRQFANTEAIEWPALYRIEGNFPAMAVVVCCGGVYV